MNTALNPPLVSIVVPLYNAVPFLQAGLASVYAQTFADWELVAINDGSTDNTEEELHALHAGRAQPLVYHKQINGGGFAARNSGLDRARGKYIAFFDIDDQWFAHHLESLVTVLERETDIDWLFAANQIKDLTTNTIVSESSLYSGNTPKRVLQLATEKRGDIRILRDPAALECQVLDGLWCGQQFSLIRRSVFETYRFRAAYRNEGADQVSVIAALNRGVTFAYTTAIHGAYHIHSSNASAGCKDAPVEKYLRLRKALIQGFKEVAEEEALSARQQDAIRKRIAREYFWSIGYNLFLQKGDVKEARKYFISALRTWPWSLPMWKTLFTSSIRSLTHSTAKTAVAITLAITALAVIAPRILHAQTMRCDESLDALQLFSQGCLEQARGKYQAALTTARSAENPSQRAIWDALIRLAWFEDEIGNHQTAITYSNEALSLASDQKDDFLVARSLSWIGWAYSGMGRYEAALQFYENALSIAAPDGTIRFVMIWGLSAQERGALLFKMGRVAEGREALEAVYSYAKEHGIDIGVTESAVHLSEVSLHQGRISDALSYAENAVTAANRCNCGPAKIAKARVALLKARVSEAQIAPTQLSGVKTLIEQAMATVAVSGDTRSMAELKMLLSKTIPATDFEKRYELVSSAYQSLTEQDSELRSLAAVGMGQLFLQELNTDLAKFYLEEGITIQEEQLRKIDRAFTLDALASLQGIEGKQKEKLLQLKEAADSAAALESWPQAAESQLKLAQESLALGYSAIAHEWAQLALETSDKLIALEPDEAKKNHFKNFKLEAKEIMATAAFAVTRGQEIPQL
jgi:glycosyltransferase involved in cell wall biosynthesis